MEIPTWFLMFWSFWSKKQVLFRRSYVLVLHHWIWCNMMQWFGPCSFMDIPPFLFVKWPASAWIEALESTSWMRYPNPWKTSGRCSTLHISCTKCLPVFCWFNPHQDIQQKKQSPSKLWLAQIPHGLSGAKKTNPRVCLVQNVKNHRVFCRVADIKGVCKAWATPQTAWYPAAPAWEHQHKPLEFGSEILDKTQVTTSEHRLKMRNKWKNGVGIVRFK